MEQEPDKQLAFTVEYGITSLVDKKTVLQPGDKVHCHQQLLRFRTSCKNLLLTAKLKMHSFLAYTTTFLPEIWLASLPSSESAPLSSVCGLSLILICRRSQRYSFQEVDFSNNPNLSAFSVGSHHASPDGEILGGYINNVLFSNLFHLAHMKHGRAVFSTICFGPLGPFSSGCW